MPRCGKAKMRYAASGPQASPDMEASTAHKPTFTGYEKFVIAVLAFLQFTVILDFMILSPLGAFLMPGLNISPEQFGWVVSAYALSAGVSGITAAGFADKFDRKKMLLVFYTGFIVGTLFCGLAPTYHLLLAARIFTGIFGGVLNSIGSAIITDLFPMQVRGRVMGFVQMAFASSQVLGIPLGLYFANHFGWHSSFLMIVGVASNPFSDNEVQRSTTSSRPTPESNRTRSRPGSISLMTTKAAARVAWWRSAVMKVRGRLGRWESRMMRG